jgi:hypothetical protein
MLQLRLIMSSFHFINVANEENRKVEAGALPR